MSAVDHHPSTGGSDNNDGLAGNIFHGDKMPEKCSFVNKKTFKTPTNRRYKRSNNKDKIITKFKLFNLVNEELYDVL